jgi:hypothetical protein
MLVMRVFAGNQGTSQKAPLRSKIVDRSIILGADTYSPESLSALVSLTLLTTPLVQC